MSDPIRLEFLSEVWLDTLFAKVRSGLEELGERLDGVEFSMCETVTRVPAHLCRESDDPIVAWWLVVAGRAVRMGFGERSPVTYAAEAPYCDARAAARRRFRPVPADGADDAGAAEGPIPARLVPFFVELHNYMTDRTI